MTRPEITEQNRKNFEDKINEKHKNIRIRAFTKQKAEIGCYCTNCETEFRVNGGHNLQKASNPCPTCRTSYRTYSQNHNDKLIADFKEKVRKQHEHITVGIFVDQKSKATCICKKCGKESKHSKGQELTLKHDPCHWCNPPRSCNYPFTTKIPIKVTYEGKDIDTFCLAKDDMSEHYFIYNNVTKKALRRREPNRDEAPYIKIDYRNSSSQINYSALVDKYIKTENEEYYREIDEVYDPEISGVKKFQSTVRVYCDSTIKVLYKSSQQGKLIIDYSDSWIEPLQSPIDRGYYIVNIDTFLFRVNRLMLLVFTPISYFLLFKEMFPDEKLVARHIDDNVANNHISNLKWGNHMQNMLDKKGGGSGRITRIKQDGTCVVEFSIQSRSHTEYFRCEQDYLDLKPIIESWRRENPRAKHDEFCEKFEFEIKDIKKTEIFNVPEEYKHCKTYDDFQGYLFDKSGNVYSLRLGTSVKCLKGYINTDGYIMLGLSKKRTMTTCRIHAIIASLFVFNPNPEKYNQIEHKDGIRNNNNANNLMWVTHHENQLLKVGRINRKYDEIYQQIMAERPENERV